MQMVVDRENAPARKRAYSVKEAAGILMLCERTLRTLIAQDKVKAPFVSAKRRLIPDTEIDRILSEGIRG